MMEYHEIGEIFFDEGKILKVVPFTSCSECAFSFIGNKICSIPYGKNCNAYERIDNKYIMYKLINTIDSMNIVSDDNVSKKNDRLDDKPRWELLPLEDIEDIVKVYTAGAKKYGPDQWQNLPDGYRRYKAALFRHILEYEKGNWLDPETGSIHLAQVAWNAIAMLHIAKQERCKHDSTQNEKQ